MYQLSDNKSSKKKNHQVSTAAAIASKFQGSPGKRPSKKFYLFFILLAWLCFFFLLPDRSENNIIMLVFCSWRDFFFSFAKSLNIVANDDVFFLAGLLNTLTFGGRNFLCGFKNCTHATCVCRINYFRIVLLK